MESIHNSKILSSVGEKNMTNPVSFEIQKRDTESRWSDRMKRSYKR